MEGHFALATMAETVGRQELRLKMFIAGRMPVSKHGTYQKRGLADPPLSGRRSRCQELAERPVLGRLIQNKTMFWTTLEIHPALV